MKMGSIFAVERSDLHCVHRICFHVAGGCPQLSVSAGPIRPTSPLARERCAASFGTFCGISLSRPFCELATERENSSRFPRSVEVASQNATLPVAFSANDGADTAASMRRTPRRGSWRKHSSGSRLLRTGTYGESGRRVRGNLSRRMATRTCSAQFPRQFQ